MLCAFTRRVRIGRACHLLCLPRCDALLGWFGLCIQGLLSGGVTRQGATHVAVSRGKISGNQRASSSASSFVAAPCSNSSGCHQEVRVKLLRKPVGHRAANSAHVVDVDYERCRFVASMWRSVSSSATGNPATNCTQPRETRRNARITEDTAPRIAPVPLFCTLCSCLCCTAVFFFGPKWQSPQNKKKQGQSETLFGQSMGQSSRG